MTEQEQNGSEPAAGEYIEKQQAPQKPQQPVQQPPPASDSGSADPATSGSDGGS